MRSSKNRSRSKQNRQRTIGNIINRVFDSSGPEGKVRGTPQQIIDKYLMLARDAQLSNDRVAEQNFLQHAEHYSRMLSEAQAEMAREQAQRQGQQGQNGGQQGGQQRDRDYRSDRDDDDAPGLSAFDEGAEQPDVEEIGLVETPEQMNQRREEARRDQNRRDDRGDRGDRGERRDNRDRRDDRRGERKPDRQETPAVVAEQPAVTPIDAAPAADLGLPAFVTEPPAKPARARKPRKADDAAPVAEAPSDTTD
ncbi:MAG: hypothetical protein RLZZ528_1880 [Pseudomonadota bacterium]|jgi:hypothetical protein